MSAPLPDMPDLCWPIDPGCLGNDWDSYETSVQERATAMATATLYRLTLGSVGGCPAKVRPVPQRGCQGVPLGIGPSGVYGYNPGWWPYQQIDGSIVNCGYRGEGYNELELPGYIGRVDELKIDGVVIDPTDYVVLDHSSIAWRGTTPCPWPHEQDLSKPDTEPGTYSVTYLAARPVDGLGAYAAGVLAVEFAKACAPGSKGCRLPAGTTAVIRNGVSFTLVSETFPNGRTGISEVDQFISLHNPTGKGMQSASTIWSPDMPRVRYES